MSEAIPEALMTTGTFPPLAQHNHNLRIKAVKEVLLGEGVTSVLDIGCGDGALLEQLQPEPDIAAITGIDRVEERLDTARSKLLFINGFSKLTLLSHSMLDLDEGLGEFDAAVMLDTIEHVEEERVPEVVLGLFGRVSPRLVVVTTPDASSRLTTEQLKQRGHLFEWDIPEFARWAQSVAREYPYEHNISQLNGPTFIRGTQIATFRRSA